MGDRPLMSNTVASLRLVSPAAVTDGVTLFTSKSDGLFSRRSQSDDLFHSSSPLSPSPPFQMCPASSSSSNKDAMGIPEKTVKREFPFPIQTSGRKSGHSDQFD